MTIAQLIECIMGKYACLTGEFQDATPFSANESDRYKRLANIGDELTKRGYSRFGEETMYSGFTGEVLSGSVFIGPTYYRRLKHMIMDKLSARSTGAVQMYTRQPANQGRKNGIKLTSIRTGGMETDVMVAHGGSGMVRERLLISSDKYTCGTCEKCGFITENCSCKGTIVPTTMPYAFKLVSQYISALQVKMSIKTNP